jgi:hypothetical protein
MKRSLFLTILMALTIVLSLPAVHGDDSVVLYGDLPHEPCDDPQGIPPGCTIIEGDIIVPEISTMGVYATNLWPNGIVPYEFDPAVTTENRARALGSMREWEISSGVDFIERTTETNYVYLQNSNQYNSSVGMVGGKQVINIYKWELVGKITHELGHSLGLWHEQSRVDRDTYVTIEWDNIAEGYEHNFNRQDEADVYGPYDFGSIMHYSQCTFSNCTGCHDHPDPNCRAITVNPPWDTVWQNLIGFASVPSALDRETMLYLYHNASWMFVNQAFGGSPQLGTFEYPYTSLNTGVTNVPVGGTVIIFPGTYSESGLYSKKMKLRAPIGGVVLDH